MNTPEYYSLRRTEVIEAVPAGCKRILSVGCGFGVTEAVLVDRGCEVWGIEREPAAAEEARGRLSRVICSDADQALVDCPIGYFDCLIMADILEHLPDPWTTLAKYRRTLRDGGGLVVSLPNVGYVGVVVPLILGGRWEYQDSGVLDRTHLRFFTQKTATALVRNAGFVAIHSEARVRNVPRFTRLASRVQRLYYMVPLFRGLMAKQFILRAEVPSPRS